MLKGYFALNLILIALSFYRLSDSVWKSYLVNIYEGSVSSTLHKGPSELNRESGWRNFFSENHWVKQITTGTSDHFFHLKLADCEKGVHCLISITSQMKLSNLSARII